MTSLVVSKRSCGMCRRTSSGSLGPSVVLLCLPLTFVGPLVVAVTTADLCRSFSGCCVYC